MDKKKLGQFIGLLATVTAAVVIGNYIVKGIDKWAATKVATAAAAVSTTTTATK
jgi:hypothetical protein